ncbi:tetratricopeptide repeat protein [Ramlibacter sp. WS9]|uniref:tetratricopeptide repeat protein n=1 Tax=Ramlibacter sp. WS9 TaxID=1882741 RepID=UPI0013052515|nr:tetratricopeptide repeat protein [Ramlibacter sp. WS9]
METKRASLQSRLEGSVAPAATAKPKVSSAEWRQRGNTYLKEGNLQQAANCYRRGLESDPKDATCYSNLGYVQSELGHAIVAQEMLSQAVKLNPVDYDAHYMLGNLARTRGEWLQATACYREALRINPGFDTCRRDLCISLAQMGRIQEATAVLEQGPAFAPDTADFHYFRGNLRLAVDECDEAIVHFRQAAQLQPQDSSILINLGVAQLRRREVFSAIQTYRNVLEFEPDNVQAHANLGAAFQQSGQLELAVQSYRRALQINPEYLNAHQNLLFSLTYLSDLSPADYLSEARRYGARVTARAKPYSQWLCPPFEEGARPLRVGMVSGDFRTHPVGLFLEGILANLDPAKLTIVAYSASATEDVLSDRLKGLVSEWNSVAVLPDDELARKIHADRIDILVDLAGHTGLNRLPVFAWKAAPHQVAWLGYWGSTGVSEIDHILVDPVSVPASDAQYYSEQLWYLPDTRLCMSLPTSGAADEVKDLPALRKGYITFGSYQILNKINDRTLALWSKVLAQLPTSRLRLQSLPLAYGEAVANMKERLTAVGIDIARVDLHGGAPREAYLASYDEVDMILDTYPFPGGTTTAEALWMGVPTVTLTGHSLLARQGESLLRCVGLADWVASSEEEYVEIAAQHASDLKSLGEVRAGLRQRAINSPLFDSAKFARNLEDAFVGMAREHAER